MDMEVRDIQHPQLIKITTIIIFEVIEWELFEASACLNNVSQVRIY